MFEPVQKCENNDIAKQNQYTLKLFIAVKLILAVSAQGKS